MRNILVRQAALARIGLWPPRLPPRDSSHQHALVAGGGLRCGQVIGSTTRWGEQVDSRPVHFRDVFATLYQRLGIDVATTQFNDLTGRPQYLVGSHRPLPELIG